MSKGSSPTVIQSPTPPPAPSATESAEKVYQARLQYEPLLAEHEYQLQQKYMPSQTALEAALYGQYAPQIAATQMGVQEQYAPRQQALERSMYPQQTQLIEALSGQALQRMQNPFGYSEDEMNALNAVRERQAGELIRGIRERANLGGGLYGGRAANTEQQALMQLSQQFANEDIGRKLAASQQALQYATPVIQVAYPQVATPGMPTTAGRYPLQQAAVPGADTLYNAMYQAGRPQYFYQPGRPGGVNLGILGQWGGTSY